MSRCLEKKSRIWQRRIDRKKGMPTKHIDDETWRKVEKEAVKATIAIKKSVKETEMLKWLILKGIEELTEDDYEKIAKSKASR